MYLALYRKYRPKTFDDVISQEHITRTLQNQVKSGTSAHAYLFTGSRGTGKTTCAKILAAAVNCLNPQDGNPCLECECCRAAAAGEATDIAEMDAASNNGVEDVRRLRDEVMYAPVFCKYRVYIIDEVHMLSPAAFNALLKTLEEPPEHVKFILATTELHKVPATIVSRCQRFEFRRINAEKSAARLCSVAENENIVLENDAALLISRLSDGGMRDALSILDRCATADRHVTSELVRECAGVADSRYLFEFSEKIAGGDSAGCIRLFSELHKGSKDAALVIDELSGHFRDLMLCKTAQGEDDLLGCMPSDAERTKKNAELFTLGDILRCLELLRECADKLAKTRQRRTLAEMCLVRMCAGLTADDGERTVKRRAEMRVKEPPREEFIPTPPEKMSRESLINLNRMTKLMDETFGEATKSKTEEKAEEKTEENPTENIEEYGNEDNGTPRAESADEKARGGDGEKTDPQGTQGVQDIEEKTNEAAVKESAESAESGAIPADFDWEKAVESCPDMFLQTLLAGSYAEADGGALVIRSDRPTFCKNIDRLEANTELHKQLCGSLGFSARLVFKADERVRENKNETAQDKFLSRAKALGVVVEYRE